MLWNKRGEYRPEDYAVRPTLRILGALLLGFLAYLFAGIALETFLLASVPPRLCKPGKGQLVCEVGNWINAMAPPALQGPLAAVAYAGAVLVLVLAIWWLLKPLFKKPRSG